ncbi:MAG: glycosyltransferase family 39 protein [Bacteroidales bacterium]|nr:glycosyltransferase family 39 protein [Bacteroidales bacterium]
MKKKWGKYSALLLIVLLGILYQFKYINEFPSHIHAWSQSDRYALALGYVNNNLNFFKPETFSLLKNNKNIEDWKYPTDYSITAVDFPMHDYIPAIVMKITGDNSPWIFRLYIALYSFLGLFFLFKLSFIWTKSYYRSILIILFTATSPVFVYYQAGFLPTIPSLSNAIIGIYFYSQYLLKQNYKYFPFSLFFLTFAALSRTPFLIPLIAVFGIEMIRLLKRESRLLSTGVPIIVSILMILSHFFYNKFLTAKYGSIFLANILPASSFKEAVEIINITKEKWITQYFSSFHYIILALSLIGAIYVSISKKKLFKKEKALFLFLIVIIFIGCILYAILMLRQFVNHDYYFLDTFFLPIVLFFIVLLSVIPIKDTVLVNRLSQFAILLICIPLSFCALKSQEERRITGYWDRTAATIINFQNSEQFIDSLGIPSNSKMLIIDAYATNIPLILLNRKGYPIIKTKRENIIKSLEWDYDYIVLQNEFLLSDIYSVYPEIITRIKKNADNGKISIYTRSDSVSNQSLIDFLGLNKKEPVFSQTLSFDNQIDSLWQNVNTSNKYALSDVKSGYIAADMVYGLTYKSNNLPELRNMSRTLLFSSYFLKDSNINCEIVVSINENGQNVYYKSFKLEKLIKQVGVWEDVSLLFQLPKVESDDYEFAIFIWNIENSELFYEDFSFYIY